MLSVDNVDLEKLILSFHYFFHLQLEKRILVPSILPSDLIPYKFSTQLSLSWEINSLNALT